MISLTRPLCGAEDVCNAPDDYKIKEKINGNLILSEGKRAKLGMEYRGKGKALYVEVFGDTVQSAVNAPLGKNRIERQMRKTGETQFELDRLDIETEGDIFLPMQSLNALRREGLRVLEEQIVSRYHRERTQEPEDLKWPGDERKSGSRRKIQLSVQTKEQLREACRIARQGDKSIDTVYVDGRIAFDKDAMSTASELRSEQVEVFVAMPYIFRDRAIALYEASWEKLLSGYDGVLIRNWESYGWLRKKRYDKPIVSDYNLYVFNKESRDFIIQAGIRDFTLSPELNFRELKDLGGGGILRLTDRYKKRFPVKNYCGCCYNVMYNCTPLVLAGTGQEIEELAPSCIRLDFTTEGKEEMERALALYEREPVGGEEAGMPDMEYTRGHFRRGVK